MNIEQAISEYSHLLTKESSPRHLGELLFAYVLGKSQEWTIAHLEFDVNDTDLKKFVLLASRYAKGEPLAYLTNKKEFYGLEFYVDERVLIPRPETEYLVEEAVNFVQKKCSKLRPVMLDIGTGSGNIAISIAKQLNEVDVFALDVSEKALEVALINARNREVNNKIQFIHSNLLDNFFVQKVDVIVANLPYIGTEVNRFVESNTLEFEPNSALFAGSDGLDLYKKMFQQLQARKIDFSFMVAEFGFGQSDAMKNVLNQYFDHNFRVEKDLAGIDRYFIVDFS